MNEFQRGYEIGKAEAAQGMKLRPAKEAIIRYYAAGFGRTVGIAAAAAPVIPTGALTRDFRGERLVTTNDVAGSFSIVALTAGPENLMVNALGIPARVFVENGDDVCLDFPTVQAALGITVTPLNFTGVPATFEGGVLGYAAIKTGAGTSC